MQAARRACGRSNGACPVMAVTPTTRRPSGTCLRPFPAQIAKRALHPLAVVGSKGSPSPAKYLLVQSYQQEQPGPVNGEARIKVIGVGGGGGNALNRMIEADLQARRGGREGAGIALRHRSAGWRLAPAAANVRGAPPAARSVDTLASVPRQCSPVPDNRAAPSPAEGRVLGNQHGRAGARPPHRPQQAPNRQPGAEAALRGARTSGRAGAHDTRARALHSLCDSQRRRPNVRAPPPSPPR
jgi:hypothetical protein